MNQTEEKRRQWIGFRDVVLVALLSVLSIVIQIVSGIPFAALPQLMMFISVGIIMVACGPVYVLIVGKVPRRGAVFMFVAVQALYYVVIGQLFLGVVFLVCAVLCELSLMGDGYERPRRIAVSYMIFAFFYVAGSYLPYLVLADQYIAQLAELGVAQTMIDSMMTLYTSPTMIGLACLNAMLWAAVGTYLGYRINKKHFSPAGII